MQQLQRGPIFCIVSPIRTFVVVYLRSACGVTFEMLAVTRKINELSYDISYVLIEIAIANRSLYIKHLHHCKTQKCQKVQERD